MEAIRFLGISNGGLSITETQMEKNMENERETTNPKPHVETTI